MNIRFIVKYVNKQFEKETKIIFINLKNWCFIYKLVKKNEIYCFYRDLKRN